MLLEDEEFRELSNDEKELIEKLMEVMKETASDFTDTFRTLGDYKLESKNIEEIAKKLVELCAPVAWHDKKANEGMWDAD